MWYEKLYRFRSIKDENGGVLFEQKDCEVPAFWSQLATNVVVSKYFYGENGTDEREKSVRQTTRFLERSAELGYTTRSPSDSSKRG